MQGKNLVRITLCSVLLVAGWIIVHTTSASADSHRGAEYFTNTTLTTQDGQKVHFYDDLLKGKIVAINLIYTNCEYSCPLETARLAQVQKLLGDRVGKDIFFYSISIDPVRDTPAALKAYAAKFHAGPGWTFLTGKKEDIDLLSKKLGLYSDPRLSGKDGHTPHLLIGNEATGQWMRDSASDNPKFLANLIGNVMSSWRNASTAPPKKSYSEATPIDLSNTGKYLFTKECAACHTIGHGDKIGPDLLGVTNVRDPVWLRRYIHEPDKMIAEKDPIAVELFSKYKEVRMPNLRVGDADMDALINFLASKDQEASAGAATKEAEGGSRDGRPHR
jgi:protein SCO1/2